ncbi:exocrine gland-secreted peptide 1-like [Acomys russatus]|uniref:exocrine gland-secreted peptide 1-like n=1 Tax=Acomys russatus TaxID=60746 RepID=UPI0021E2FC31|nr:exocrine gland-secreted peptide 1-like [Acomys russatus]
MASLPVMLFLTTLLFPSMLTEGRVLTQIQKEPTITANHKTNNKTVLGKIDSQGEGNITEALERTLCACNQDQTVTEDQAKANQHSLNQSKFLIALVTCVLHVDPINFSHKAHRFPVFRVRQQQDNFMYKDLSFLDGFLFIIEKVLFSH